MNRLNCNCFPLTAELVQAAISRSGLAWRMHPAQVYAVEAQGMRSVTELRAVLENEDAEDIREQALKHFPSRMMAGIPVVMDSSICADIVELQLNGETVFTLEHVAVPAAFDQYV